MLPVEYIRKGCEYPGPVMFVADGVTGANSHGDLLSSAAARNSGCSMCSKEYACVYVNEVTASANTVVVKG